MILLVYHLIRVIMGFDINLQVIDFHMQLQNYKQVEELFRHKFGEVEAKKRLTSAVYLFSIGANDYLSLFLTNSSILTTYTKSEYVDMVIGNITYVITEIYNTGGRKFAFLNVPKIGCVPVSRISNANGECNTEPSEYAMLHNKALFHVLEELKLKLPGFKFSLYDFSTYAQQRIDYPSKYGFKEGKTACCGTGKFRGIWSCGGARLVKEFELCENVNDYVFWDSTHFTEKVYEQLADEMWNLHSYGSHSIKELFYLS
ncbi:GDSL esterase/lipase 5-like [Chenopodium quinoa]|uniref:GDSL esterase/lipase 5-like n=1 Tax=Chenopodium quinoa TaxID=63459 RepID=UPI000B77CE09|nr:GDSL esterase/lipase 5-like [Chenopodium quinoa]